MKILRRPVRAFAVLLAISPVAFSIAAHSAESPAATGASAQVTVAARRLSESEYRHTIEDVFGPDIEINARFEPEKREQGLLAVGNAMLSLTSGGFEQYFILAADITDQAFDNTDLEALVGCSPKDASGADPRCARQFITHYGELIFRRPLTEAEVEARLETANQGAEQTGDFHHGLNLALTSLLVAPEFLFRVETAEPDPNNSGAFRLDGYTKAARLSFLFWNSAPDHELLRAARDGELHTEAGLKQQLDRLVAAPRFKDGARAFFEDMFQLDGFENMVKDPAIYPKFNQTIANSAKEQMLKTAVGLLVEKNRDYRELFTSNETYINRPLASVYNVPYGSAEEWMPYTFKDDSERAGILTQVGFLSQHAHPGTSSPTLRGIKLHEIFRCEPTPDPPADVDFSAVQASEKGTARERLLDHMENPGCNACHRRSDPPGLALEHFDGIGQVRKFENGELIDVSADFNGVQLDGAKGLADYLKADPRVPACLVRNVYAYGTGLKTGFRDEAYLAEQAEAFAEKGYRIPALMQQIANTPEFFKVHIPEGVALNTDTTGNAISDNATINNAQNAQAQR
ncbi:MAG: DUF1592 domain-containing protein [Cellvibrionaceae bacterium]